MKSALRLQNRSDGIAVDSAVVEMFSDPRATCAGTSNAW
jgi:hypothetical protein